MRLTHKQTIAHDMQYNLHFGISPTWEDNYWEIFRWMDCLANIIRCAPPEPLRGTQRFTRHV